MFAPRLRGRPVVVLSNNDGCVIARTVEAKALGIPMGAPAFQYLPVRLPVRQNALTEITGETQTDAIWKAVAEFLERQKAQLASRKEGGSVP